MERTPKEVEDYGSFGVKTMKINDYLYCCTKCGVIFDRSVVKKRKLEFSEKHICPLCKYSNYIG